MKVWSLPFTNVINQIFIYLFFVLIGLGIGLSIHFLFQFNLGLFFAIGLLTFAIYHAFLWWIQNITIIPKLNLYFIRNISIKGFELVYKEKVRTCRWKDVHTIDWNQKAEILTFHTSNGKPLKIKKDFIGFYKLLKQLPENMMGEKLKAYQKETFSNLITCKICGNIAFKKDRCLCCGSESFNDELREEFKTEEAYIKAEQLEYFSTMDKYEKVDFFTDEEGDTFRLDKNWKPLVTEEEVLAYSKEEWWNL